MTVAAATIAAAAGGPVLLAFVEAHRSVLFAVGYSTTCLVMLWWLSRQVGRGMQTATAIGVAFGPLGILAMSAAARLFRPVLGPEPGPAEEAARPPREKAAPSISRILDHRIRHPEAKAIGSLMAALRHGTLADRQAAVEVAVGSFEPRLSPIVARALTDREQTIRALGASASAQVIQNLLNARRDLEREVAKTESIGARRSLALLLSEHGRYNVLLSEQQRDRMLQDSNAISRLIDAETAQADVAAENVLGDLPGASNDDGLFSGRRPVTEGDWAGSANVVVMPAGGGGLG